MKQSLNTAIIVSLAVHAALIALIAGAALFSFGNAPGGGGQAGSVIVTYVGEEAKGGERAARLPRDTVSGSIIGKIARRDAGQDGAEGAGAGGVRGEGAGSGRGKPDPILAQIRQRIDRAKRYPWIARKNGWEGAPRVTFSIDGEGRPVSIELAASCGIDELDRAAIETVQRSAPLPRYPRNITIAIRYSLQK